MVEIKEASAGSDTDEATPLLSNLKPHPNPNPPNRTRSRNYQGPRGGGPPLPTLAGNPIDRPETGRGVPIEIQPRNGRSIITYRDGSKIYVDGEPKDSLIKPITRILVGIAVATILIVLLVIRDPPEWAKKLNMSDGRIPPWLLACAFVAFTRMRKRTRDFLESNRK
ncbi:hypothetical protein HAX54_009969 [Datura stramonium]|uniref:Uncharacterized protein n=1 Tax=Datura stramonium TaxID=4076 RepID=A0ABS8TFL3_DATST|nr:hypothetical protein [Datura stramonium]